MAADEWEDQDLVFPNTHGRPLLRVYVNRRLTKLFAAAGLPRILYRELRHTGATLLLAEGQPIEVVQELLGHTSIVTTRRYARVVEAVKRDVATAMDGFLRGATA